MKRSVILHYHLFKNAGSSIDALLLEAFGEDWASWDPGHEDSVYGARDVMSFLKGSKNVRALSSHTLRLPEPFSGDMRLVPLVLLRHPILRAASVYKYDRSLDGQTKRQQVAMQSSFAEYTRWVVTSGGAPIINNFQTLYLSGDQIRFDDPTLARAERGTFLRATTTLEGLYAFGIVERFSESLALFEHHLKRVFPTIAWREVRENVGAPGLTSLEEIKDELGDDLYARLEAHNAYDLALYDRANKLFDHHREAIR